MFWLIDQFLDLFLDLPRGVWEWLRSSILHPSSHSDLQQQLLAPEKHFSLRDMDTSCLYWCLFQYRCWTKTKWCLTHMHTHTHRHPGIHTRSFQIQTLSWNTPCWLWLSPSHEGTCKTEAASVLQKQHKQLDGTQTFTRESKKALAKPAEFFIYLTNTDVWF